MSAKQNFHAPTLSSFSVKDFRRIESRSRDDEATKQTFKNKNDPFAGKTLRFYESDDHYEMHLCGDFHGISDEDDGNEHSDFIRICQELRAADHDKELHIFINSYGGYMDSLLMLLHDVTAFKHIVTITTSTAASCGFLLWIVGDERYVSPMANIVYHEPSFGNYGKVNEVGNSVTSLRERYDIMRKELGIEDILTKDEIELGKTSEVYLSGDDLIKRQAARDYSDYLERTLPDSGAFYTVGPYMIVKTDDGNYHPLDAVKFIHENIKHVPSYSWSDLMMIVNNHQIDPAKVIASSISAFEKKGTSRSRPSARHDEGNPPRGAHGRKN